VVIDVVREIFLKWGDDCRWILRCVSLNYAATGMTVERMQIRKVTCDKSREYSTVTRDHHIFFGGNQQLVQYRVSLSILTKPKNGFDQNPGANLPAQFSLGGLAR
jgi:hypothetical protein